MTVPILPRKWMPLWRPRYILVVIAIMFLTLFWFRATIWREIGMLCLSLDMPSRAVTCFREVLKQRPDDAESQHGLGVAVGMLGRWNEAVKELKTAVMRDPNDPDKHYNLGVGYDHIKRPNDAITEYKIALQLNGSHVNAGLNLALHYAHIKQYERAIQVLQQIAKAAPDDAEVQYELGLLYAIVGDEENARRQLRIVQRLDDELAAKLEARLTRNQK